MSSGSFRPRPGSTYPSVLTQTSMRIDKDEELGKRDDDFRPRTRGPRASNMALPHAWRWRKRRILVVLAAVALVYVFIKNIPTDLAPWDQRPAMAAATALRDSMRRPRDIAWQARMNPIGGGDREPTGAPPRTPAIDDGASESSMWYYDGTIKFYRLAQSLRGIAKTMGQRTNNRNVLFVVSSLKSAANLMPMACEMARWDRSHVHMALFGRDPLPLADILEVNAVNTVDCTVYFHDARPDYSAYSSDRRAESSIFGAMMHINDFMHPQALVMDDPSKEDKFFTRAMRSEARRINKPLIEIPAGKYEEFLWISRLDSGSLSNWFKPTIDILVNAPQGSAGSLIRLIHSLQNADYSGLRHPRLIIELPPDIDPAFKITLELLDWPPGHDLNPTTISGQTLQHRIPGDRLGAEQASVRFLEAWWPGKKHDNHVLVLSPQVEVGPLFLQYLHYTILEYRYSSSDSSDLGSLLGISLITPSMFLNGSEGFEPPKAKDMLAERFLDSGGYNQNDPAPFLYGAPSAAASLIFGDRWITLHDFLSKRISATRAGKAYKTKKLVPETEPAWLEYLLELMRARHWTMLMPAVPFATVHNDLAQVPDEFLRVPEEDNETIEDEDTTLPSEQEPFLTADTAPVLTEHKERETGGYAFLHDYLPFNADLAELRYLPYLTHTAEYSNIFDAVTASDAYAAEFREEIGGCEGREATAKRLIREPLQTDELFCLTGIEIEYDQDDADEQEAAARQIMAEMREQARVNEAESQDEVN